MYPIVLAALIALPVAAQKPPAVPEADRLRIAEAFRLADELGNRVWPGWDKSPFAVLLVTADHEFLIRHPKPDKDFALVGEDDLLRGKVWHRPRRYAKQLLATFPAVGGVSTVVIGQAENTESKDSSRWVITLLHEHFHQLQDSQPRFYAEVDSLGLAKGDTTGMWMLNYPFPYAKKEVKEQFSRLARTLKEALEARDQADFADRFAKYLESRKTFRALLQADEHRYLAFQLWKEGIARYTEIHLAELAAKEFKPSQRFRDLKDFRSFEEVSKDIRERMLKELATVDLAKAKRTVVYNFGAAEGLLLDRTKPNWRKEYFEEKFSLDGHFTGRK
jgi:hypothetical protein